MTPRRLCALVGLLALAACGGPAGDNSDSANDDAAENTVGEVAKSVVSSELINDTTTDLILANGRVYLGQAGQVLYDVVVRDDRIVYVGLPAGATDAARPNARRIDLGGRLMLPGLHDVHLHPLGIVPAGNCDLDSRELSLEQLVPVLKDCIDHGLVDDAGWLVVSQWAFSYGNAPSAELPTMRAALDAVSTDTPIILLGNDGHHGAVNGAALALAQNAAGTTVGLTRDTLQTEFADYRKLVGVDASGEMNGLVNETARYLFGDRSDSLWELPPLAVMPAVAKLLARSGITSIRDASADVETLGHYDYLTELGKQTFRLTLALNTDFDPYRDANGNPDFANIVEDFKKIRERYAPNPLIRADQVKLFVDGVLEGDPISTPPMLPNAAMLAPYRQPIFARGDDGLAVTGYVDAGGPACRAAGNLGETWQEIVAFVDTNGFHPSQCATNNGALEHPVLDIHHFVGLFDRAGFTVHAHAIGDRAVRIAIDAFSKARRIGGQVVLPHSIGHAQVVHPDDVSRAGALGLNIAFTYAWIIPDRDYDLSVVPFIDAVQDNNLYEPGSYYFKNMYPVASLARAGAMLTAGSDAPVDTRDPRPFYNIEQAVTRANEDQLAFNETEAITIHAAIAAYTKNGAVALNQSQDTGTIEVGKKADLIVIDRNIVKLATSGRASEISDTENLLTVFDGKIVYAAGPFAAD